MKILHALVGYLAVTALSFDSFHPFAFASLLAAIDYDGYVDTAQNHIDDALMKHVLGTIVETCQTVTAQNYSESVFMNLKRVPDDSHIIEARQLPSVPAPVIGIILFIVAGIIFTVLWIADDDPVRGNDI